MMKLAVGALALATWHLRAAKASDVGSVTDGTNYELFRHNEAVHSTGSPHIQPSHSCWLHAFQVIEQTGYGSVRDKQNPLGSATCADMTHQHQQFLAFELTRCHMESVGRPLVVQNCDTNSIVDNNALRVCLGNISDSGLNAYTHFFTYINQVCLRLTQELSAARNHEIAVMLNEASELAVEKIAEIQSMQNEVFDDFQEQQKRFMTYHQEKLSETTLLVMNSMSEIESKKDEILEHQEHMKQKQHEFEARQDKLFVRFDERIEQQEHDMKEIVTQVIGAASEQMQPLLDIESLVVRATIGFSWFTSFVHFLGTLNLAWLLTLDKRCRRSRRAIFCIILIETLAEFVVHWMARDGLLSSHDSAQVISFLRSSAFSLECGAYLVGIVMSLFAKKNGQDVSNSEKVLSPYHVELVSRLEEHKAQIRQEQMEQEERLVRMLSRSIQETIFAVQQNSSIHTRDFVPCPLPPFMQLSSPQSYHPQTECANTSSTHQQAYARDEEQPSPSVVSQAKELCSPTNFDSQINAMEVQLNPALSSPQENPVLLQQQSRSGPETESVQKEGSKQRKKRQAEEYGDEKDAPAEPETKKQKIGVSATTEQ